MRAAGQWREGDPDILVVFDAGYDTVRLSYLLVDLPIHLLGRVRSDRVFCPPPAQRAATGRPPRHGPPLKLADDTTWPEPDTSSVPDTTADAAEAWGWHRLHPRLKHRDAWADHEGPLPTITGALIRLRVDRLPGDHAPTPVWLWSSRPTLTAAETDRL